MQHASTRWKLSGPVVMTLAMALTLLTSGCRFSDITGRGITQRIASSAARFALNISALQKVTLPAQKTVAATKRPEPSMCALRKTSPRPVAPRSKRSVSKIAETIAGASSHGRPLKAPESIRERIYVINFGEAASDAATYAAILGHRDTLAAIAVDEKRRRIPRVSAVTAPEALGRFETRRPPAPCRETNPAAGLGPVQSSS
ncbi:MAG: hypothetical protein ABI718_12505 [Acidobacteriota bacterium]